MRLQVSPDGKLSKKPTGLLTNSAILAAALDKQCVCQPKSHAPLMGVLPAKAAVYTRQFVNTILTALSHELKEKGVLKYYQENVTRKDYFYEELHSTEIETLATEYAPEFIRAVEGSIAKEVHHCELTCEAILTENFDQDTFTDEKDVVYCFPEDDDETATDVPEGELQDNDVR
jgi:hypothetical protein